MSVVCVQPKNITDAERNYSQAQAIYTSKRKAILEKIKAESDVSGEQFVKLIQQNLRTNMQQAIVSPRTGQSVRLETILKHLYSTTEELASEALGIHSRQLNNLKQKIDQLKEEAISNGRDAQKEAEIEIDKIVQQYVNEMQLDSLIYKYLPQFISKENAELSLSHVFGYVKSILKHEISKRVYGSSLQKVFSRHPSIILGYIREDATTDAANKAREELGMRIAKAQTVGGEQSKIDILIPLTERAAQKATNSQMLKSILSNLDQVNTQFNLQVEGESVLETNEFLGIQSKPWKMYLPTTSWNRLSIGSRAGLLKDFKDIYNPDGSDNTYSWHNGVYYLSTKLEDVIGANTVMYIADNSVLWTDDLFDKMREYHKYFAFMLNSEHKLTSHVQMADHTDG